MSAVEKVLKLLRDSGGVMSGEEIAKQLGISRNSVWKAVKKLQADGYRIDAKTNCGYTLLSESCTLSPENISRSLTGAARIAKIEIRDSVSSTNTVLKELAEQGKPEGTVLIARQQSAGKGRMGRSFFSPKGTGLYMSILLRPKFSAEESLFITTAAAVAVAGAVEEATGRTAKIKWVNDVYLDGYKVCGILTEASVDFETRGLNYAVLGIGVNLQEPEGGFSEEIREVAGALFEKAPPGAQVTLAAGILNRFFNFYSSLTALSFLPEYRERSLLTGAQIHFLYGNESYTGKVIGIDETVRLLVELEDGTRKAFSAGEVAIEKDFLNWLRQPKEKE